MFKHRVDQMICDAYRLYKFHVRINQSVRDASQAQKFHICHMFLHNYFRHRLPRDHPHGARTIDWAHLSDAKTEWALIDQWKHEFLVTNDNQPAKLQRTAIGASWLVQPDPHASRKKMAKYLSDHHVTGMAAPGVPGCGEPCNCGGHQSKHITGEAYDLHRLDLLGFKIKQAEPGLHKDSEAAVDDFLRKYHLWRPMAHLPGKAQEIWHIEALPYHAVKHSHVLHLRNYHTSCGGC